MRDAGPSAIETARLRLRAYRADDLDRIAALYAAPEVTVFTRLGQQDRDQAAVTLDDYIAAWLKRGFGMRAVFLKPDFDFVGECGLFLLANGEAALRYALLPAFWGHGLTGEAVAACVDDAFARTRLPRIFSVVQLRNAGSIRVMEKLGWRVSAKGDDRGNELAFYQMTRDEWLGARVADAGMAKRTPSG